MRYSRVLRLAHALAPWRHGRGIVLTSSLVAALAVGGIAWATIPDSAGVLHGCYNTTTGALRVIDPSKGQTCASGEAALSWNQSGIRWRGYWVSTTAYAVHDAIMYNGSAYLAMAANTGVAPTAATDSPVA